MNSYQTKQLIKFLAENWSINSTDSLEKIIDLLELGLDKNNSRWNTFEGSLVSFEKKIRLLHLNFYKPSLAPSLIKKAKKRRKDSIINIFTFLNQEFDVEYNKKLLGQVLALNQGISWPLQFGFEKTRKVPPKLKIYFSLVDEKGFIDQRLIFDRLKKLCLVFKFSWSGLKDEFKDNDFDALAVDFLPNGKASLKVYPFYQPPQLYLTEIREIYQNFFKKKKDKYLTDYFSSIENLPMRHIGFLYRFSHSNSAGLKIWTRFQKNGVSPQKINQFLIGSDKTKQWLKETASLIKKYQARLSYLTLENQKIGLYFR